MKNLTIRNVSAKLAQALEEEKRRRATSLNQTVLQLLESALGLGAREYDNGLSDFAGRWTEEEFEAFEDAVSDFERVDEDLWR